MRVVLYCRESRPNGNLESQVMQLKKEAEQGGAEIIAVYSEVTSGSIYSLPLSPPLPRY